jgi:hypothetical protein
MLLVLTVVVRATRLVYLHQKLIAEIAAFLSLALGLLQLVVESLELLLLFVHHELLPNGWLLEPVVAAVQRILL